MREKMSASGHDGVAVIKPGQTYVGKQGFTYGAGASTETVGAQKVCMNILPMPAGAVAKAHYHKGIETIAYMLEDEVHSSGRDQDGIVLLPELDEKLAQRMSSTA
jgi:uncharacterized RmlC-like cupin family protein